MWLKYKLMVLLAIIALISPSLNAETKTFFGVDAVDIETKITYANGDETYDFTAARFKYGLEDDAGGSVGIELITGDSEEIIDPFGSPFELETGPALGIYATLGKPVYIRVGWSTWKTEYTDVTIDLTDTETVQAFDIGLGINLLFGRNMTFYADYALRDTDARYPKHVTGNGQVEYESELLSVGFNLLF